MSYSAGWNIPGYLPETDPATFDDIEDAAEYLASEIERGSEDLEGEDALGIPLYDQAMTTAAYVREWTKPDDTLIELGWGQCIAYWIQEVKDPRVKLTIEMELSSAAFDDHQEIERILSETARRLTRYGWTHRPFRVGDTEPLFDVNGNTVGRWTFSEVTA